MPLTKRPGDCLPASSVLLSPGEIAVKKWRFSAPQSPPFTARHEHAALVYCTRGEARYELRECLEIRAGDVVIVPAGEAHRMLAARDLETWAIGLHPTWLDAEEIVPDPFLRVRRGALAVARIPEARRSFLETLLGELAELHRVPGDKAALRALLTLVLREVERATSAPQEQGVSAAIYREFPDRFVTETLGYIEQHCTEKISLRDVAAALKRSPAHLTTRLRQLTGRSVGDWITAGRMAEARRRLLHSDEHVEIIGERVGYADVTHFIRTFRREHGQTPAAWRTERKFPIPTGTRRGA